MLSEGLRFHRMQDDSDSYSLLDDLQASYNSPSPTQGLESADHGLERPWKHPTVECIHGASPFVAAGRHETNIPLLPSKSGAILKQITPEHPRVRPRSGTTGATPITTWMPISAMHYQRNRLKMQQEQKKDKGNANVFSIWSDPDDEPQGSSDSPDLSPSQLSSPQHSLKLKQAFQDVLGDVQTNEGDIVDWLKSRFEEQTTRIRRLEHALREKEDSIRRSLDQKEESDRNTTVKDLLDRFPQAMQDFRREVEAQVLDQQFDQLEVQKQALLEMQVNDYKSIKQKYRQGFERIIQRLLSDPAQIEFEYPKLGRPHVATCHR